MEIVMVMYRILCFLEKCKGIEKFDDTCFQADFFRANETEFVCAIEELLKHGCIDGVSVRRAADDSLFALSTFSPRITYEGIKFLHIDPLMLQADKLAKSQG
jgi:hypothetical protein